MKQSYSILALALASASSFASITAVDLGTGAPPASLGGYAITLFPDDGRPVINDVSDVPSPLGGDVTFSPDLSHRKIGTGWATWSHGYTGDVYYSNGATSITLGLPADTAAFLFYAEPNPFAVFTITATANDGTLLSVDVDGFAGANGYGFYTTATALTSITVSSSIDFAVGEFGIAKGVIPETSTVVSGAVLAGLLGFGAWRRFRKA